MNEHQRHVKAREDILKNGAPEKRIFVHMEDLEEKKKREDEVKAERERRNGRMDALKDAKIPWFCPECDKVMKKRLDNRMWYLYGHCFDCQIDVEHKMKIAGVYDEWEEEKIKTNKLAWLQDKKQELIEFKKQKTPTFYNQVRPDGYSVDKETWNMGVENIDKLANEALKHLEKIEESLK